MSRRPDRIELAPGLEISRIVTGLWQIADMEKDGRRIDLGKAAADMADYAQAGFDSFDMAEQMLGHAINTTLTNAPSDFAASGDRIAL